MTIAIIGAGMAGLSCAAALVARGLEVRLFDKGRGPGGRMSTRRVATPQGEASFDHGAQYFTARDPAFRRQVDAWAAAGLAARWPAAGPEAWVGSLAMNAPIKDMAARLPIAWSVRVDRLHHDGAWTLHGEGALEGRYETVLMAVPAENAAPLLAGWDEAGASLAREHPADPCWTVMAAFAAPVPSEDDVLREHGAIGWAARNSAKPGRGGPEAWIIQAGPSWSRTNLELPPERVETLLMAEFETRIGVRLPATLTVAAHRWRYARSGSAGQDCLWNDRLRLGVCGDWLIGPRVEAAWRSGAALAARL